MKRILIFTATLFVIHGCNSGKSTLDKPLPPPTEERPVVKPENDMTLSSTVISTSFVGNGAQWGGYDEIHRILGVGNNELSAGNWQKLFERVRFMRPGLVRLMGSCGWNYLVNGDYDPSKSDKILIRVLDFCQAEGVNVIWGEWGHQGGESIDETWLGMALDFLSYLVNTRGYSCIKYYNMVNEPAGSWASTKENYNLWKTLIDKTYAGMKERGLLSKVQLIGPDAAVWTTAHLPWVTNSVKDLDDKLGAYDIHTYPIDDEVRSDFYASLLKAYRDPTPKSKPMLMGELGYKYGDNSLPGMKNTELIAADVWSSYDSNMMIYYAFYGIDMALAYIRNMAAGYRGIVAWDMDDAMYHGTDGGFKRWGFWNILGEEMGKPADKTIRPWFYPVSLLCRYFPSGCDIYKVTWAKGRPTLDAVAAAKNNKYTLTVCNFGSDAQTVNFTMTNGRVLENAKIYRYKATSGFSADFTGKTDSKGLPLPAENLTLDLTNRKPYTFEVPAQSVVVITTME